MLMRGREGEGGSTTKAGHPGLNTEKGFKISHKISRYMCAFLFISVFIDTLTYVFYIILMIDIMVCTPSKNV